MTVSSEGMSGSLRLMLVATWVAFGSVAGVAVRAQDAPGVSEIDDLTLPADGSAPATAAPEGDRKRGPGARSLLPSTDVDVPVLPPRDEPLPPAHQLPSPPVVITELPQARSDWGGVLTEADGGLGWTMWEGTDTELAGRLLAAVPVSRASPVMRDLTRRLLLSRAARPAPPEPGPAGLLDLLPPDLSEEPSGDEEAIQFLERRLELLVELADIEGLRALGNAIPGHDLEPFLAGNSLARRILAARLAAGDVKDTCGDIRQGLVDSDNLWLRKALVVCQVHDGRADAARLTLQLLEPDLEAEDPFVNVAYLALDTAGPVPDALPPGDVLIRLLYRVIPGAVGELSGDLPSLRLMAEASGLDPLVRLAAAERAESAGILPVERLAPLYAAIEFPDDMLTRAAEAAGDLPATEARALLYQAALNTTTALDRARYLRLLWDRGGTRWATLARATAALTASIPPRSGLVWFSAAAARSLLAAGLYREAEAWVGVLAGTADLDFAASGNLYALFPPMALAGLEVPEPYQVFPSGDIRLMLSRGASRDREVWELSRLLVLLEAMGIEVPPGSWATLFDAAEFRWETTIPTAPVRYQLRDALAGGRIAETVLFVLIALGPEGPAVADPVVLNAAVRGLRAVGLEDEARAMALEAALAETRDGS